MLIWLILALMTAAVLGMLLRPLVRAPVADEDEPTDQAVYRDQLAEIDQDLERGLIGAAEAEAARVEISRRLLRSSVASASHPATRPASDAVLFRSRAALATTAVLPVLAALIYVTVGSPGLPSQPLSAMRAKPAEQAQIEALVLKVEDRLRSHPEDGRGWDVIAPVYAKLGRHQDALQAYRSAIRLLGESSGRLRGAAESAVFAAQGVVTEEARGMFARIRAIDPADPLPRFWLAMAKEQDGKGAEAVADYRDMLASAPSDAGWRPLVEERLKALGEAGVSPMVPQARPSSSSTPARGPTEADVAAAQQMKTEDRAAMINQMVAGLAARLEKDGKDLAGWQRLLRAYVVLGRKGDAASALASARRNFAGDEAALAELAQTAKSLGIGS